MKTKVALIPLFGLDSGIRYISSYLNSKGYFTNIISFGESNNPKGAEFHGHARGYLPAGAVSHKR